nr:nascent polypeptide-associated complex subunit alpha, muscle-specific form-like [Symphalangus syndactylus]XP_055111925.1 nascent polypeptide-associated complex subunit alpha, muscle-specific form-like [Symphalangus syndactylus]XP_055111926.1 nascent polypeptide-associated complex subunit alpha, muscle-specific form-like [Symphalangus syndactylus]
MQSALLRQKLSLSGPDTKPLQVPALSPPLPLCSLSAPSPRSAWDPRRHRTHSLTAGARPGHRGYPARARWPRPAPTAPTAPTPVSSQPPGADQWRQQPQVPGTSDKRAGGGGVAEPRVLLRRRRAPPASADQPRRLLGLAETRGGKGRGSRGGRKEAAGAQAAGYRLVVLPGPRKEKWEERGARRPASSAAQGDGARHIRDLPAVAVAGPAARASAPAAVVTPPRLAVAPVPVPPAAPPPPPPGTCPTREAGGTGQSNCA